MAAEMIEIKSSNRNKNNKMKTKTIGSYHGFLNPTEVRSYNLQIWLYYKDKNKSLLAIRVIR